jgi:hypothetical protein
LNDLASLSALTRRLAPNNGDADERQQHEHGERNDVEIRSTRSSPEKTTIQPKRRLDPTRSLF